MAGVHTAGALLSCVWAWFNHEAAQQPPGSLPRVEEAACAAASFLLHGGAAAALGAVQELVHPAGLLAEASEGSGPGTISPTALATALNSQLVHLRRAWQLREQLPALRRAAGSPRDFVAALLRTAQALHRLLPKDPGVPAMPPRLG